MMNWTKHQRRGAGLSRWIAIFAFGTVSQLWLAIGAIGAEAEVSAKAWSKVIPATAYDRSEFRHPESPERIAKEGNLSGRPDPRKDAVNKGKGRVNGWVEYDFTVPAQGWYEISLNDDAGHNEYLIDGVPALTPAQGGKAGSVWLETGNHALRLERRHWRGFGPISEIVIRQVTGEALGDTVSSQVVGGTTVFRLGDTLKLDVSAGARQAAAELVVQLVGGADGKVHGEKAVTIGANAAPETLEVTLPLDHAGVFRLQYLEGGQLIPETKIKGTTVVVVDATPLPPSFEAAARELVMEIDCVERVPDFENGGESRIVERDFGSYRESGDVGYLKNMNAEKPSWFSYRLELPNLEGPYIVEVDAPDDVYRTMIVQVRQGKPEIGTTDTFPYTMGVGFDSGGEFRIANRLETLSLLVWPTGRDWRITLITPQDGSRAAASRIRIYRVTGELRPTPGLEPNGRPFVQWYEEGLSYLTAFGGSKGAVADIVRGTNQWLKSTAYMGASRIISTVAIYQMAMYPSKFNADFNELTTFDTVRLILLLCEKYGLDFIAEFAPEAREVAWLAGGNDKDAPNLLRNRKGAHADHPQRLYSPVHPVNQEWYLAMLRDFVEQYVDMPAFRGISLRAMEWANPGLINFHSLDWGYDDFTVQLFEKETGIDVPVDDAAADRFQKRADWILANKKSDWIAWRCLKVTDLYGRVTEMVRSISPNLIVYSDLFPRVERLEAMGIDLEALSKIEGLELIHSTYRYGRRADTLKNQETRDGLVNRERLMAFVQKGHAPNYLFNQAYIEATKEVTPNWQLDYAEDAPHGWMSGVANPLGRQVNERWALALAEADAQLLGDGGNAYTLGQPATREFLQQYRQLPQGRFEARPEARDPVAVWEAQIGDDFWFYAVNREVYPIPVEIEFEEMAGVVRAIDGQSVEGEDNVIAVTLQPYELIVWRAKKGTVIRNVEVSVPEEEKERVVAQVAWLTELVSRVAEGSAAPKFTEAEREQLSHGLRQANEALALGHLRTARSYLEGVALIAIYEKLNEYPPGLRDMGVGDIDKESGANQSAANMVTQ